MNSSIEYFTKKTFVLEVKTVNSKREKPQLFKFVHPQKASQIFSVTYSNDRKTNDSPHDTHEIFIFASSLFLFTIHTVQWRNIIIHRWKNSSFVRNFIFIFINVAFYFEFSNQFSLITRRHYVRVHERALNINIVFEQLKKSN